MTRRVRLCAYCYKPLRLTARSDARFCCTACKAASRRQRQHDQEAVRIGLALITGETDERVVRCPSCRRRFVLGHLHRRDSTFCSPRCRQAAYRARLRQKRAREAVTASPAVTPAVPLYEPATSADATEKQTST